MILIEMLKEKKNIKFIFKRIFQSSKFIFYKEVSIFFLTSLTEKSHQMKYKKF